MIRTRAPRFTAALLLFLSACAASRPGAPIRPGMNVYSPEQDVELGRQAAAEIRQQMPMVLNASLQEFLNSVGMRLAQQPEAGGYPYSFQFIADDSINAFALPGGPVFVHTGLLKAARTEGEFAGVIAHEISHVALRHSTNQATKANLLQLPALLAGVAIGQDSMLAQLGQAGLGLGLNSLLLKYSRTAENQADALGARILAKAGYNPLDMANFFETLEAQGGERAPEFLSSHPNPGRRRENILAEIRVMPQQSYTAASGRFEQAQQIAAGIQPSRRSDRAALRPATGQQGFEPLQTRFFTIDRPSSWNIYQNPNSNVVTLAPPDGLVRSGLNRMTLGYGAVMSYYRPQTRDLNAAAHQLLSDLRAANPALDLAGEARPINVNGTQGLLFPLVSWSPYGGRQSNWLLTVPRPEGLFYLMLIVPQRAGQPANELLERIAASIRFR